MLLNKLKSQQKLLHYDSLDKDSESKSICTNTLSAAPKWSRSNWNLRSQVLVENKDSRFGRHNKIANEDYYRTLKDFKFAKINEK